MQIPSFSKMPNIRPYTIFSLTASARKSMIQAISQPAITARLKHKLSLSLLIYQYRTLALGRHLFQSFLLQQEALFTGRRTIFTCTFGNYHLMNWDHALPFSLHCKSSRSFLLLLCPLWNFFTSKTILLRHLHTMSPSRSLRKTRR